MTEALAVAEQLCALGMPSVMMAKDAVNRSFETGLTDGIAYERRLFHSLFGTEDQQEGMGAFLEKRKPESRTAERSRRDAGLRLGVALARVVGEHRRIERERVERDRRARRQPRLLLAAVLRPFTMSSDTSDALAVSRLVLATVRRLAPSATRTVVSVRSATSRSGASLGRKANCQSVDTLPVA